MTHVTNKQHNKQRDATMNTTLKDYCDAVVKIVGGTVVHLSPRVGIVLASDGRSVEMAGPLVRGWRTKNDRIISRLV